MPTLISACPVAYKHLNNAEKIGKYSISGDPTSRSESATYKIRWEDKDTFIGFIMGHSAVSGGSIVRTDPLSSPYTAGLYATKFRGDGIGADDLVTPSRPFPWVIFTVEFNTLTWDPQGPSPYLSVRYRGSTSTATIPGAALHFSSGEYIDHDYGFLIGQFAIEMTFYMIGDMGTFLGTFAPLAGKVNSDAVTIRGYTYPAGSLLFPTLDGEEQIDSQAHLTTQATLALVYRSIPWNSGVRSDGVVDNILPAPYVTAAFSGAF